MLIDQTEITSQVLSYAISLTYADSDSRLAGSTSYIDPDVPQPLSTHWLRPKPIANFVTRTFERAFLPLDFEVQMSEFATLIGLSFSLLTS